MLNSEAFINTDGAWTFSTEESLEDFVWSHLPRLFSLQPLKRQLGVRGEFCDILAVDEDGQLTIIELKNCEDRYVVQQLTRYFDNLYSEKPLDAHIDYSRPIRLIAIAPSFHRHNYIDQKYNKLNIEFLTFQLALESGNLFFEIHQFQERLSSIKIPLPEHLLNSEVAHSPNLQIIPAPPKALTKILDEHFEEQKSNILAIRDRILSFDERIGEISTRVVQRYGLKKNAKDIYRSKLCTEFYSQSFKNDFYSFKISLWLPYANERYIRRGKYEKTVIKALLIADFTNHGFSLDTPIEKIGILRNPKPSALAASGFLPFQTYSNIVARTTGKQLKDNRLASLLDMALEECLMEDDDKTQDPQP
jgi:RecB family endonuclease NucS